METLCHAAHWLCDNQWYLIAVYQEPSKAFYTAETRLGPRDWIMVDGPSADAAMQKLRVALPEAVWSRETAS